MVDNGPPVLNKLPLSGFGSLTWTPGTLYGSYGLDVSGNYSDAFFKLPISLSISTGIYVGPPSGILGNSIGYTAGSYLGVSTSYSYDNLSSGKFQSFGTTTSYGLNFTTSKLYISGNHSETFKLMEWKTK